MGFRYQQPDNEDDFEQMSLRYYRKLWSNESLQLYAKRGEKQDGIDIHDPACLNPVRVVQCKHHEPTKTLEPADINAEVAKAEKSAIPIEQYVIATTAKKSRHAQDAATLAIRLNRLDDVVLEAAKLPAPGELSIRESRLVTGPYFFCRKFDEAIKYLHAQLRLNFDDEYAHAQYVFGFLTYGARTTLRDPSTQVEIGSSAMIETDDGRQRWVSIEDDKPAPSRNEFASASKIAQCLLGR